ncbi:MAG: TIGR04086 family membrane protein [Lachnoclostridium sp.]|jgi:putative membrane protein (TIGR04086 family)|nr:TIGR04086 family membrane protein [Lachnoclostridium sp.]
MKRTAINVVKYLFVAYVVTMIILAILALLLYKVNISEGVVNGGVVFSYIFSSFIAGLFFCKQKAERKFLWGALIGFLYFVIIMLVSVILNRQLFMQIPNLFSVFTLCTLGGMMGGMLRSEKGG